MTRKPLEVLDKKPLCFGSFDVRQDKCQNCLDFEECRVQDRRSDVVMDGFEFAPSTDFQLFETKIYIFKYKHTTCIYMRVPKPIVNLLKLQHKDKIEVAIRKKVKT